MRQLSRQTKQKALLQENLYRFDSFFTAEDLYHAAKKRDKTLGIATVYRFLKHAKDTHNLHTYIYDRRIVYSLHKKSQCRFICQKCHKTTLLEIKSLDFLKKKVTGNICHFQITVEGICDACKQER